jgi:hypothetical protein
VTDINRRRGANARRKDEIGAELAGAKQHLEQFKVQRTHEQRAAARETREPNLDALDAQVRAVEVAIADLTEKLAACQYVDAELERELLDLHASRRSEFIDQALELSDIERTESQRTAKRIRDWIMTRRTNAQAWVSAWNGISLDAGGGQRDPHRPEIFGARSNSRVPGAALADLVALPSEPTARVDGRALWDPRVLAEALAAYLERASGLPSSYVPPDALQGRAGVYRNPHSPARQHIGHGDLNGHNGQNPSTQLLDAVRIDPDGLAQLVWERELPDGYVDVAPLSMDDTTEVVDLPVHTGVI